MKAVVAAFKQEKALVGAFYVLTNLRMELFQALMSRCPLPRPPTHRHQRDLRVSPGDGLLGGLVLRPHHHHHLPGGGRLRDSGLGEIRLHHTSVPPQYKHSY